MKIGIVALTFAPGKSGGIEIYFRNLIEYLQKTTSGNQYFIFLPTEHAGEIELTSEAFKIVPISMTPKLKSKIVAKLKKEDSLQLQASKEINSYMCDLIHFPLQIIYPAGVKGPKVLSFMDLQQEYYPEFFSQEDLLSRAKTYRPSAEAADHIIAISNHTKASLTDKYLIPAAKISTIYLSYDEQVFSQDTHAKVPVEFKYFFYPAATWPHKNHLRLIEAFALLAEKYPDIKLVFSGAKKQTSDDLVNKIDELELSKRVTFMGYLPYEDLPLMYRHAIALVYPSLFEGFGIPLLEAMASDCPIVASDVGSIPEIAADAALYFDPTKPQDMAEKMKIILKNDEIKKKLVEAGRKRVKTFSSAKMADETLGVYRKVLRQSNGD